MLAVVWRRAALLLLIGLICSAMAGHSVIIAHFDAAIWRGDSIAVASLDALPAFLGYALVLTPLLILFVLLFITLGVPLAVQRMGRDRRALTYEIDETGIRTKDALGAELLLPWSNVTRSIFSKRMLLLRLRPRGWRYVPMRAFSPGDRTRIRELAVRMAGSSEKND